MHAPPSLVSTANERGEHSVVLPSVPASLHPLLPPLSSCPPFVLRKDEHALGVAFWAVPLLFGHSARLFARLRPHITTPTHELSSDDRLSLVNCTRTLLLINPDNASAWNARKRLLSAYQLSAAAELLFLSFLFSKHPKSSEAWAHRRWTAQRLLERGENGADAAVALLRGELSVVEMTAERYPKNYHAWLHRQWIVQTVDGQQRRKDSQSGERGGEQQWADVLEEEKQRIGAWNESHMSDHSGWHYRAFVIDRIMANGTQATPPQQHSTRSSLLADELSYLSSLQLMYPAHESAWSYRRFLLHSAVIKRAAAADGATEREQWRQREDRWCEEREAIGRCSSEDEWMLERRYARVHRLYVTELVLRANQLDKAAGGGEQPVEVVLQKTQESERARWLTNMALVQQVYPRQVWVDRVALVT